MNVEQGLKSSEIPSFVFEIESQPSSISSCTPAKTFAPHQNEDQDPLAEDLDLDRVATAADDDDDVASTTTTGDSVKENMNNDGRTSSDILRSYQSDGEEKKYISNNNNSMASKGGSVGCGKANGHQANGHQVQNVPSSRLGQKKGRKTTSLSSASSLSSVSSNMDVVGSADTAQVSPLKRNRDDSSSAFAGDDSNSQSDVSQLMSPAAMLVQLELHSPPGTQSDCKETVDCDSPTKRVRSR